MSIDLSIKELNAIQWQQGAGQLSPVEWIDMLKKIQKAGKSIHTWGSAKDVLKMLDYLSPKGLYVEVYDIMDSPQDAEDFIREVEKKCKA
ncbi:hypothetical protein [Clostridium sp.]|uniref:hypothetical protein n=1 Tax=Clostridium sp. TaxID=1506 RepID=UPI0026393417|nr:hypothetical protein [uncultured Clostridium sp.]